MMSSLREIVAAQQPAGPVLAAPSCQPNSGGRTLQIEPGGCERWLLAWSQFISAHYNERAGREELILWFAEYEVVVHGRRLARLFADVAAMQVECIRGQPQADLAALNGSASAITEIQIHALSKPRRPPGDPESS
jgi:hypothetical protein